jgi:hypothetical protein
MSASMAGSICCAHHAKAAITSSYLEVGRGGNLDALFDYIKRMSRWMEQQLEASEKAASNETDQTR